MVGMAGFFSAAAHVPISTAIDGQRDDRNYHLLVPTMFVSMLAFLADPAPHYLRKATASPFGVAGSPAFHHPHHARAHA